MSKKYPYQPDYAISPGATLKETLEVKGISQADLSMRTGITEKTISQIINGITPINYDTSEKLELALGISARFWNKRELSYREALARIEQSSRLVEDTAWLQDIPVNELIERRYVEPSEDKGMLVRNVLRFFGVSSVEAWRNTWGAPCVQFRGAGAYRKHPGRVAAWLRMGELAAESIKCEPYNAKAFRDALGRIRTLSTVPASIWQKEIVALCAAAGVAVVFVREIKGAGVSGVAKWLNKDKALIQLSLKYKTDDQLWFSFFHEAGHILLHGKRDVFIEDGEAKTDEEHEADCFARDTLIPVSRKNELAYLKSKTAIAQFAESVGVSPGIVVGRLQHEKLLHPSYCNDLKRKLQWAAE